MNKIDSTIKLLKEGNKRYVSGQATKVTSSSPTMRAELEKGQNPLAILLSCSDSRVPSEIVFDQGLGDLFIIRVAGNIVAPSQIGSIEFAAKQFGTCLVVVMGHSKCGAITATLEELKTPSENRSPNLRSIVERIRPAVKELFQKSDSQIDDDLIDKAVRANVQASVEQLRHGSKILEELLKGDDIRIVGAEYSLETGLVKFFED